MFLPYFSTLLMKLFTTSMPIITVVYYTSISRIRDALHTIPSLEHWFHTTHLCLEHEHYICRMIALMLFKNPDNTINQKALLHNRISSWYLLIRYNSDATMYMVPRKKRRFEKHISSDLLCIFTLSIVLFKDNGNRF